MDNALDASVILALMLKENGHEKVTEALASGSGACTVNLAEMVGRCARVGMPRNEIQSMIGLLPVTWVDADMELAFRAGEMIAVTKPFGLSLGDRYCLALAARESVPTLTADAQWLNVASLLGIEVVLIR